MNVLVAVFFGVLFFLAVMLAAGNQIWMRAQPGQWYLQLQGRHAAGIRREGGGGTTGYTAQPACYERVECERSPGCVT